MKATIATIRGITCRGNQINVNLYELRVYYSDNKKMKGKGFDIPDFCITRTSGHGVPQWFKKFEKEINEGKAIDLTGLSECERVGFLEMVTKKGNKNE